jgi:hypothetical protein
MSTIILVVSVPCHQEISSLNMLLKRLKNLWKLSAYELTNQGQSIEVYKDKVVTAHKAQVIKRKDDIINKFVNNG